MEVAVARAITDTTGISLPDGRIPDGRKVKDDKGVLAKAKAESAFPPPSVDFKGPVAEIANSLELLEGETELCSISINKSLAMKTKGGLKAHQTCCCPCCMCCDKCCTACLKCCTDCLTCKCCKCCDRSIPPPTKSDYEDHRYFMTVTDRRILIREMDVTSKAHMNNARDSCCCFDCCWFMWCCCWCPRCLPGLYLEERGNRVARDMTERVYQVGDLRDVKFSLNELHDVMESHMTRHDGCCQHPLVVEANRDDKKIEVHLKLAFVKPIADYPGPWWDYFDGLKSSQSLEHIVGTVETSEEAHRLRRALMLHNQRMAPSKVNIATFNVTGGEGGAPPDSTQERGIDLLEMLGGSGMGGDIDVGKLVNTAIKGVETADRVTKMVNKVLPSG